MFLQHEASSLLTDVKSLKVGTTSAEDAKRITEAHQKELSEINCEHGPCDYHFIVSNRVLSWAHAEPKAEFDAGFTVLDGTVTHIYAGLMRSMPIYPTFAASAGWVDEYAEIPNDYRRIGRTEHYQFPTPVGKPYLRVLLDRHADALQREHAFAFSFRCLTKPGGDAICPVTTYPKHGSIGEAIWIRADFL